MTKWLAANRPFLVVSLAMAIAASGIGMVSPLLPIFAEERGATGIWLGLAFSGFAFSQTPLMPIMGRLSDKLGKKPFMSFGLLIFTLAAIGFAWSPTYRELTLFRVFSGVGAAMVFPVAYAYIGLLAPQGREGTYMGLFNISFMVGFGAGPVLGGILKDTLSDDAPFIAMAILNTLGFLIVWWLLPRDRLSKHEQIPKDPAKPFLEILRRRPIRGLVTFQTLSGLSYGAVMSFLAVFMVTQLGTSTIQAGLVISTRSILNGVLSYPFGRLADKANRVLLITLGITASATGIFLVPWAGGFIPLLILFGVMAVCESMAVPAANAITVEEGRDAGMGSVMGVFNMAMSFGFIIGSMVGGVINDLLGINWVFRYAALMGFIGIAAFNLFMRGERKVAISEAGQASRYEVL
ncbi:MAG: MFS transporter [Chloroflexi bacterium]|nr:MFS transporter [Chloroflexota bacterium]